MRKIVLGCSLLAVGSLANAESKKRADIPHHITRAKARDVALGAVPGGMVKSAELEREHGHKIWSFDVYQPSEKNIVEVHIDADSGKVLAKTTETATDEAREGGGD